MSGFASPLSGSAATQPKQISSRLLNMKFMQRAEASTVQKSSSGPSTPSGEPRAKRRRTGDFSATANNLHSPSTPSTATGTPAYGDRTAISGALAAEANNESIRRGTNNFDAPGIETEWVLDLRIPATNGLTHGEDKDYTSDESSEVDEMWSSNAPRGRQTYGAFDKKKKRKAADTSSAPSVNTESASKQSKKRNRTDDLDDEDLSSIPSNSDLETSSEGEIEETPKPKRKGTFNMKSEADLKKMDSLDLQKAGVDHGFGRQRQGLSGGRPFASPGHAQRKQRKKTRKTM